MSSAVAGRVRAEIAMSKGGSASPNRKGPCSSGAVLAAGVSETGRGKGSGAPVDRSFAALYTVINGKIARMTTFRTEQDALEAAWLRE
jgi:ketosteroid isomerase-like protein